MMIDLRILALLHRRYHSSSAVGMQSGRFDLLITTDRFGYPMRVYVSLLGEDQGGKGQWYRRIPVNCDGMDVMKYTWERELANE